MGRWWITVGVNAVVFFAAHLMSVDRAGWSMDRRAAARLLLGIGGWQRGLGLLQWALILALGVWCVAISRGRPARWFAGIAWMLTLVHVLCSIVLTL